VALVPQAVLQMAGELEMEAPEVAAELVAGGQ
jgi:hypothetical protein